MILNLQGMSTLPFQELYFTKIPDKLVSVLSINTFLVNMVEVLLGRSELAGTAMATTVLSVLLKTSILQCMKTGQSSHSC